MKEEEKMNKIGVITYYDGKKFRSKNEAKMAYIFDKLDIKYEYESQYFTFDDGTKYLPDFYLPEYDQWVEVKGVMTEEDKHKIELLEALWGTDVVVVDDLMRASTRYEEVYLTKDDGFTSDPYYADAVLQAYREAQSFNFEQDFGSGCDNAHDPYLRLCRLKARYLQKGYYELDISEWPRIINRVNDTRTTPYTITPYQIIITCSDYGPFEITLTKNDQNLLSTNAEEEDVRDLCYQIFRCAFELWNGDSSKIQDRLSKLAADFDVDCDAINVAARKTI